MALAAIATVARPIIVEGAKEGAKAVVMAVTVYGGIAAAGLTGYGIYRGSRKVASKIRSWRSPHQITPAPEAAVAEVVDLNGVPLNQAA